jgi:hypothetical protein
MNSYGSDLNIPDADPDTLGFRIQVCLLVYVCPSPYMWYEQVYVYKNQMKM